MTIRATDVLTYADIVKRLGDGNSIDYIVEMLNATNEVMDDMRLIQCNDGTGHKTTIRTGIPEATWRLFNYGVKQVKSTTAQVRDTTGMLEVYSKVDKKLADMHGGKPFRTSEATAIMEGMSQQMASTVFYGNIATNPERFMGLAPRYATGVLANADSAENVLDGGGRTALSNTSIWYVGWGPNATMGLYPQGTQAGLTHRDLGEDTFRDENGLEFQGYRDHFSQDIGLTVRDWRQNIRIANVDATKFNDPTYFNTIINLMIQASEQAPVAGSSNNARGDDSNNGTTGVFYANRRVRSALRMAINNRLTGNLTWEDFQGKKVVMFDGTPVRRVDALLNTEAVVPFS